MLRSKRKFIGQFNILIATTESIPVVAATAEILTQIAESIDTGKVKTEVATVLPLTEIRQAHELSQQGHTRGKIVLRVAE